MEGLREIRTWDDRDVTTAKDIPRRLLVLGGGVVGCEVAQAYRDPGAQEVTVVDRSDRLVGGFEPWAGRLLAEAFDQAGIRVLPDRSVEHAAGDVNGRALLTHQGECQPRLVGDILAGKEHSAWADHTAVPQVVFTEPEIAAVGSTEQQAVDAGIDVRTVSYGIGQAAGGALHGNDVGGRAQLVIDQTERVVVGATFVGPQVGEVLHAATIAIGKVPLDTLWHAVPAFPTVSEVWLRLLEADRGL